MRGRHEVGVRLVGLRPEQLVGRSRLRDGVDRVEQPFGRGDEGRAVIVARGERVHVVRVRVEHDGDVRDARLVLGVQVRDELLRDGAHLGLPRAGAEERSQQRAVRGRAGRCVGRRRGRGRRRRIGRGVRRRRSGWGRIGPGGGRRGGGRRRGWIRGDRVGRWTVMGPGRRHRRGRWRRTRRLASGGKGEERRKAPLRMRFRDVHGRSGEGRGGPGFQGRASTSGPACGVRHDAR